MVLKPWDQRKETAFQLLPQVQAKLGAIPGIEMFPVMPPALPGGGNFPVEIVLLSTEEPERMLEFAKQLQAKAMESGKFFFPPIIDTKIDQPQAEVVIDHDKVAALGLNLAGRRRRSLRHVRRQFRQPFQHRRARLQSHSADQARRAPESRASSRTSTSPARTTSSSRSARSPPFEKRPCRAPSIACSSSTRSRSAASPACPLDQALKFLEGEAAKILPKGYTIDYTGESRQLRVEGDKFLPAFRPRHRPHLSRPRRAV